MIVSGHAGLDDRFLARTYRTSAWVLALILLFLWGMGRFQAMWSVGAGAALGAGVLRLYEWLVRSAITPGRQWNRRAMVKVVLLKLPAITLLIYWVVRSGWFDLAAFAAGVALVQTVIFLKAVGLLLVQREAERQHPAGAGALGVRRAGGGGPIAPGNSP